MYVGYVKLLIAACWLQFIYLYSWMNGNFSVMNDIFLWFFFSYSSYTFLLKYLNLNAVKISTRFTHTPVDTRLNTDAKNAHAHNGLSLSLVRIMAAEPDGCMCVCWLICACVLVSVWLRSVSVFSTTYDVYLKSMNWLVKPVAYAIRLQERRNQIDLRWVYYYIFICVVCTWFCLHYIRIVCQYIVFLRRFCLRYASHVSLSPDGFLLSYIVFTVGFDEVCDGNALCVLAERTRTTMHTDAGRMCI